MKTVILGGLVLCVFVATGCLTPEVAPETTLQIEFPLTVGSHWTYATYDSVSQQRDTILVTVDSRSVGSSGDTVYRCTYRHRAFTDSSIVRVKDDTVLFATDETPPVNFLLPFTSVDHWNLDQSSTVRILGVGTETVPGGRFVEAIHIRQQSLLPNDKSIYEYWVAPGFGIVHFHDGTSLPAVNKIHKTNWVLLSCWIAPSGL